MMEKFLDGSLEKFEFVLSYSSVEHTGLGNAKNCRGLQTNSFLLISFVILNNPWVGSITFLALSEAQGVTMSVRPVLDCL